MFIMAFPRSSSLLLQPPHHSASPHPSPRTSVVLLPVLLIRIKSTLSKPPGNDTQRCRRHLLHLLLAGLHQWFDHTSTLVSDLYSTLLVLFLLCSALLVLHSAPGCSTLFNLFAPPLSLLNLSLRSFRRMFGECMCSSSRSHGYDPLLVHRLWYCDLSGKSSTSRTSKRHTLPCQCKKALDFDITSHIWLCWLAATYHLRHIPTIRTVIARWSCFRAVSGVCSF